MCQAGIAAYCPDRRHVVTSLERDQLTTRSDPRFVELRHHIYGEIQRAKGNSGGQEQAATA